jgi:hypothetical protein
MRCVRHLAWLGTLFVAGAALSACGSDEPPDTPTACIAPASEYLIALEAVPGEARLGGETAISDCIVEEQPPGQLSTVGEAIVAAATELNREVHRAGGGRATVELGYLVGAVQEAADSTGGIHVDLVRRLDAAARYAGPSGEPFGAEFERLFGQGFAAGRESG